MVQCDRCVKEKAKHVLVLSSGSGSDETLFHKWALCGECLNLVCGEAKKSVENYRPARISEFCPSLTTDQAKQVELYLVSRSKA